MPAKKISHLIITGDSLTDRGEMAHRYLLGIIPLRWLSGLGGDKSPEGRFTNRFTWADHFIYLIIEKLKQQTEQQVANNTADEAKEDQKIIKSREFDNYLYVGYQGHQDFVRCYAEGGMTSHDYSWTPSKSFSRFFSRLILTNLNSMRERLLRWDRVQHVSDKQKAQTLFIEWSGANDLITVNEKPSETEARQAVRDRIKNVKKLIKNGYQNFALFNMPDLSLTPRFQALSQKEKDNAQKCCNIFNQELALARTELSKLYPHCSIDIFDVNSRFKKIVTQSESYGFTSKSFPKKVDSNSDNYLFWNDVHPSDRVHKLLAKEFEQEFGNKYNFTTPKSVDNKERSPQLQISSDQLLEAFKKKYASKVNKDFLGWFGIFRSSNINYKTASLKDILRHALYEGGHRTKQVIENLQWIDKKGNIKLDIPVLRKALQELQLERNLAEQNYNLSICGS